MLGRIKLAGIEAIISGALINTEISHADFMTVRNEEKKYRELKESIRMMNSQGSDAEKITLIEEGKKKKKQVLMTLLSVMKLLITVLNNKFHV